MTEHKKWYPRFLEAFAVSMNWSASAKAAGITRNGALAAYDNDPEFRAKVDEAKEVSIDALEITMRGHARKSDRAAGWMLERLRPETYNIAKKRELTGADGAPIAVNLGAILDERIGRLAASVGEPEPEDASSPEDASD